MERDGRVDKEKEEDGGRGMKGGEEEKATDRNGG